MTDDRPGDAADHPTGEVLKRPLRTEGEAGGSRLLRRATMVSAFTTVGVILGFLVDVLLVARFGMGSESDAFFGGYTVPLIVVTCLVAIEPVLVTILSSYRHDEAAFGVLLTAAGLVGLAVAAVGALLARPLVDLTAPGFDAATAAHAAHLARILFARVPAAAVAGVCKAELYARRRFGLGAFSNVLPSLVTVLLLVATGSGWGIEIVAIGFVVGAGAQAALLVGLLFGWLRVPYRPTLRHSTPVLKEAGRLVAAPLAGLLLRQGVVLAERFFGSHLAPGSVTALSYANRLTMTVAGVAFDGISTASLPALAERWREGPIQAARRELARLVKLMVTVALPLGLAVSALGTPLVHLFFERGQVDRDAAILLGSVLSIYALSLPALGPFRAAQTFFYAVRAMRLIVFLHGGLTALTVLLSYLLVGLLGAQGLALSFALSSAIIAAIATLVMARRSGEVGWRSLADSFWRLVLASAAMGATAWGVSRWIMAQANAASGPSREGWMLTLALSGLAGLAAFLGLGAALRLEPVSAVRRVAEHQWRRLKR